MLLPSGPGLARAAASHTASGGARGAPRVRPGWAAGDAAPELGWGRPDGGRRYPRSGKYQRGVGRGGVRSGGGGPAGTGDSRPAPPAVVPVLAPAPREGRPVRRYPLRAGCVQPLGEAAVNKELILLEGFRQSK